MKTPTYFALTVGFAFTVVAILLVNALNAQNYTGSQTRMGGFLESEFAPTQHEEIFQDPLFTEAKKLSDYDRYYDIIVVGDSFSQPPNKSWVNFVARDLNASALVFHIDKLDIGKLLQSETFKTSPPKYLFLQSSEGQAFRRFSRLTRLRGIEPLAPIVNPVATNLQGAKSQVKMSPSGEGKPADLRAAMGISGHNIKSRVERALFGVGTSVVRKIAIDCPSCFSNRSKRHFLISSRSIDPLAYKFNLRNKAVRGVETLKSVVETNCRTQVRTVIFPNKINIYGKYTDFTWAPTILDDRLPIDRLSLIPLRDLLVEAVDRGVTDVYAPHDHHATVTGFRIAGKFIAEVVAHCEKPMCNTTGIDSAEDSRILSPTHPKVR